jgi:methyl-accepting chemotaxis protein
MVQSVNKIAHSIEDTSGSTQSIAATTEERSAAMLEIQSAFTVLAKIAEELDENINKFEL